MLKSEKLKQELDEKNVLLGKLSKGSDEWQKQTSEYINLAKEVADAVVAETKQRASIGAMGAEDLEKQALLQKANVSDFVKALLDHKSITGASAEARSAFGCIGEYEIPLELFEPADKQKAITPAPSTGDRPVDVKPVQPFVYQRTVAGYLGIDMPVVSGGEQGYAVLTTQTPSAPKAKDAAADSTAAAITVHKSNVKRLTGSYVVRVEDVSQFPQLENALRQDIPRSIANTFDQQLLSGSGAAPQLKSLLSILGDPAASTAVETFATFISTITGLVDGLFAYELKDLKALVGMKTYEKMTEIFAMNTAVSSADYLHDKIGGLRASNRIASPSGGDQQGIVRLGNESMVAVSPVWGGIQLIDDPYTDAGKGHRTITAYQLVSDVLLLRPDAFKQIDFDLS